MPELRAYPDNNPEQLDDLVQIERLGREAQIDENWDYYDGRQRQPLKVRKNQSNDNVIINLTRRIVEQSVAMLFSEMPAFDLPGDSDAIQSWEERLGVLWERNQRICCTISASPGAGRACSSSRAVVEDDRRPVRFVRSALLLGSGSHDMQQVVCYRTRGRRITNRRGRQPVTAGGRANIGRHHQRRYHWRIRVDAWRQGNWSQVNGTLALSVRPVDWQLCHIPNGTMATDRSGRWMRTRPE